MVYHQHFGLAAEPFSLTPDPAFLFLGRQHREALAAVEYGIRAGRGFVTLVGEVGTGKTTVLYALLSRLTAEASVAFVSMPAHDSLDILRCALKDFGVEIPTLPDRIGLLQALNAHLVRMADAGRPTALVIDEAQNLSDETFEELRMLSNFETFTRKLIQIVLVGQPELEGRLDQPRLRQLRERISVRAELGPLERAEMLLYISHRLGRVGATLELFEPRALERIVRQAAGIPRRANILCHNALLFAYGRKLERVTPGIAREVVREMQGRRTARAALPRLRWPMAAGACAVAAAALAVAIPGRHLRHVPAPSALPDGTSAFVAAEAAAAAAPGPVRLLEPVEAAVPSSGDAFRTGEASAQALDAGPLAPSRDAGPSAASSGVAGRPDPVAPPPIAAIGAAAAPADGGGAEPLAVEVPVGASLLSLAREAYGSVPALRAQQEFFEAVRRLNPSLRNVDLIRPGDRLLLPAPAGSTTAQNRGQG